MEQGRGGRGRGRVQGNRRGNFRTESDQNESGQMAPLMVVSFEELMVSQHRNRGGSHVRRNDAVQQNPQVFHRSRGRIVKSSSSPFILSPRDNKMPILMMKEVDSHPVRRLVYFTASHRSLAMIR